MFSKVLVLSCLCVFLLATVVAKKASKEKTVDPKECEVCISNLNQIDNLLEGKEKKNKEAVRSAIGKHCTKSGFGSEWKPSTKLTSAKDIKMCYIFEPIKEAITTPFITGMPKERICKKLKKDNPDVCDVKYRKLHHENTRCSMLTNTSA